jgi:predicted N-acyltransferase
LSKSVTANSARLVTSAAEIGPERWNALANPARVAAPHPFTTYEFFAALEQSGSASRKTGWQPAHLLAPDGLMPLYLKNHSQGEYVFDHAWAEALERAGGDYYPKLQCSVPFTPVTGRRLLTADAEGREKLLKTAAGALRQINASSLHITFLTEEEWQAAGRCGYLQRTGQQFHWENRGYDSFDQFLGELSSAKRKTLRKERASVRDAGVTFDWLTGKDITEAHWDLFFEFYMDTGSRKWGSPYLNREFFSRLSQGLGQQTLLVMAKKDGRTIAGALKLFGEGVLFVRNWGAADYIPFLHFETCY